MTDDSKPHLYSGAWWEMQTPEALKSLKADSFPGGKAYDGAVAELDRRAKAKRERRELWLKIAALALAGIGAAVGLSKLLGS